MFNKQRKEIYLFYDVDKVKELYMKYREEVMHLSPILHDDEWDTIFDNLFTSEIFEDCIKEAIYQLEMEIILWVDESVNETISNSDS
jgi:hypothetical protein